MVNTTFKGVYTEVASKLDTLPHLTLELTYRNRLDKEKTNLADDTIEDKLYTNIWLKLRLDEFPDEMIPQLFLYSCELGPTLTLSLVKKTLCVLNELRSTPSLDNILHVLNNLGDKKRKKMLNILSIFIKAHVLEMMYARPQESNYLMDLNCINNWA